MCHPICYLECMLKAVIVSSALVASSAAGAVALSVLHNRTFEVETRVFTAPAPVVRSYVAPTPTPEQTVPLAQQTDLPAVTAETPTPLAKIIKKESILTPVSLGSVASAAPEPAVPIARSLPTSVKRPEAAPRIAFTQDNGLSEPTAPVIVGQVAQSALAPIAQQTRVIPAYTIGVYR